jgi:hypothetical protein
MEAFTRSEAAKEFDRKQTDFSRIFKENLLVETKEILVGIHALVGLKQCDAAII